MKMLLPVLVAALLFAACTGGRDSGGGKNGVDTKECSDPVATKKIADALSLANVAGMSEEEAKEWLAAKNKREYGLMEVHMDTTYEEHCVLSVLARMEGLGAYPSTWHKYYTFDQHDGSPIPVRELFSKEQYDKFLDALNAKLEVHIADARKGLQNKEERDLFDELLIQSGSEFSPENLVNYFVENDGVNFVYLFDFPHMAKSLQPLEHVKMSITELKPYLHPSGPLGHWAK